MQSSQEFVLYSFVESVFLSPLWGRSLKVGMIILMTWKRQKWQKRPLLHWQDMSVIGSRQQMIDKLHSNKKHTHTNLCNQFYFSFIFVDFHFLHLLKSYLFLRILIYFAQWHLVKFMQFPLLLCEFDYFISELSVSLWILQIHFNTEPLYWQISILVIKCDVDFGDLLIWINGKFLAAVCIIYIIMLFK